IGPAASRIAFLFESAREFDLAASTYAAAAQHTAQMLAHREAATLARRGIAILPHLADTAERRALELTLLVTLGGALIVTEGYAADGVRQTYVRARELCATLENRPERFPVLWGLWSYYESISEHETSRELAIELLAMAEYGRPGDQVRAGWAHGT